MRVAVAGAGIAGLTVAVALARDDHTLTVYEQARALGEIGAGLQLAPNAVRVLRGLGVTLDDAAVRPVGRQFRHWRDARVIATVPYGDCEQRYGAPYLTVHRPDLLTRLLEEIPPATVRLGARLVGVQEGPGGVGLALTDGHTARADVLVGADGIHSVVRARVATDEPRFSGQYVYRGVVAAARCALGAEPPAVWVWPGPGRHCVAYPIAGGRLISFAATVPATGPGPGTPGGTAARESWSEPGDVAALTAAYAGWCDDISGLFAAATTVQRWALHDRDPIPRWSTPRTSLAGDAAHPMLPFLAQGANQAVEDAAALAAVLRGRAPSEVRDALARYASVRAGRTAEIQRRSRANQGTLHLGDGPEQEARDAALAAHADLATQDWLFGYDPAAPVAGPQPPT